MERILMPMDIIRSACILCTFAIWMIGRYSFIHVWINGVWKREYFMM